jgi:hypothetical protein
MNSIGLASDVILLRITNTNNITILIVMLLTILIVMLFVFGENVEYNGQGRLRWKGKSG